VTRAQALANVENTIKQDIANLALYKAQIDSTQTALDTAQQALAAMRTTYRNGLIDYQQVQTTADSVDQAKYGLAAYQMQYITGVYQLEFDLNTKLN
jgi:outer membrane protein TolC